MHRSLNSTATIFRLVRVWMRNMCNVCTCTLWIAKTAWHSTEQVHFHSSIVHFPFFSVLSSLFLSYSLKLRILIHKPRYCHYIHRYDHNNRAVVITVPLNWICNMIFGDKKNSNFFSILMVMLLFEYGRLKGLKLNEQQNLGNTFI